MEQTPQEFEVWYILPAIRKELVMAMKLLGMQQKDIASTLSITGAAVSQYVNSKRAKSIVFDHAMKDYIKSCAKRIVDNPDMLRKELMCISRHIKESGALCKMHKNIEKCVPHNCDICFEEKEQER